jgi:hypothetical protein
MSITCSEIKKEYFNCIKSKNLGFESDVLKYRVAKLENFEKFYVPEKIMKACKSQILAKCLEEKYEIKSINDKELADYYNDKYQNYMNNRKEQNN